MHPDGFFYCRHIFDVIRLFDRDFSPMEISIKTNICLFFLCHKHQQSDETSISVFVAVQTNIYIPAMYSN